MPKASEEFLRTAVDRLDAAWRSDRHNREDAQQDLKFLAGDQWPAQIRLDRERANRPVITVNQLPQFVRQVTNSIRMNPREIKFIPADGAASEEIADILTGLMRHIQIQSGASAVYANAAEHAVSCGIGHFRVATDYVRKDCFDQEILIKRIHQPLSVYWAPDAKEPDRSDADYCFVTEQVSEAEFKRRWPKAALADVQVSRDAGAQEGLFWRTSDYVLVAEYWYKEPCKNVIGRDASGKIYDLTDVAEEEFAGLGVTETREIDGHKVRMALISGSEVLEEATEWVGEFIPIFPVIGAEAPLDSLTYRYGLVRFARDSQRLYNFWRSAAAESIALAPKSPILATPEMIAPFKSQWDTQNTQSRPYLLYRPDPNAPTLRPERIPGAEVPAALVNESNMAGEDIKATIGMYQPQLGMVARETSGVAIRARDQQADTGTFHFSDNVTITLRHLGRVMCDLIPKIYDSERTIRILSREEKQQFVEINKVVTGDDGEPVMVNDLTMGKYDVQVKPGPSNETARAEAAAGMLQFVQAVPQAAPVMGDLLAKTQDWPDAEEIAARLKVLLPPPVAGLQLGPDGQPVPPQIDPQQQAEQQEAKELARLGAIAEARKKLAEAAQAETDARQALVDLMFKEVSTAKERLTLEYALGQALTAPQIDALSEPAEEGAAGAGVEGSQGQRQGESAAPDGPFKLKAAIEPEGGPQGGDAGPFRLTQQVSGGPAPSDLPQETPEAALATPPQ